MNSLFLTLITTKRSVRRSVLNNELNKKLLRYAISNPFKLKGLYSTHIKEAKRIFQTLKRFLFPLSDQESAEKLESSGRILDVIIAADTRSFGQEISNMHGNEKLAKKNSEVIMGNYYLSISFLYEKKNLLWRK